MINHIPGAVVKPASLKDLAEYLLEHRGQHYGHHVERYGVAHIGPRHAVRARIRGASGRSTWVFYGWLEEVIQQVEGGAFEGGHRNLDII